MTNLSFGQEMPAIPGPSIMPQRVLEAMARPLGDLYAGPILEASDEVRAQLPTVAGMTEGQAFIVISNGHGAWQMATSNTLARGDKILVLESGRFPTVWGRYTAVSDVEVELVPADFRGPVDLEALEARLEADTGREIRAVLCAHVDTASSVRNDIGAIRAAIDAADHPALLMVDCIASMGCEEFRMDDWRVDIAVAGCQKGLMVPPGVAFVWASPRALAAHHRTDMRVGYLDWDERLSATSQYQYYAGTPPMSHLYGLREAFRIVAEEGGWPNVWRRHEVLADAAKAAIGAWAAPGGLEFTILDPAHRSNCVTTVMTNAVDGEELRRRCHELAGVILGIGIGVDGFRLAHMGHLNPPMLLGTIGTIEAVLASMDAPLGSSGVAAAAAVVAEALAD